MKNRFLHPLFLASTLLFAAHQWGQKVWGLSLPWLDGYLDPVLCMPILLTGYSMERGWLTGRQQLTPGHILLVTSAVVAVSEIGFPRWSAQFTADPWDAVAFLAGSTLFFLFSR